MTSATVERQEIEEPTAPQRWSLARVTSLRVPLSLEIGLYAVVIGLAALVRFWDLGGNALHHDESIHAQWAWDLTRGQYTHNPIFHGPLYYHAQALVNLLFGASDYTARASAALFGVALVLLPLLFRRRLGPVGTFSAVALLAFSPTVVYYSRFMREDIYMAAFTLLMAVSMWRYIDGGRDRWLIVFALALAGSFATKEATFLTVAIFLLFLNAAIASALARDTLTDRGTDSPGRRAIVTIGFFPYAWAIAALWPFIGGFRRSMAWLSMPRAGDVLIILGTLTVPLLTPILKSPFESLGLVNPGQLDWPGVCSTVAENAGQNMLALGGIFTMVAAASAFIGLQWRPRTWAIAAGGATLLYLTLMTTFWTNFGGLCSGPWGSLDYWLGQQQEYRGNQPWFYYHMLMPAYEFLPLIIAAGGLWWSVVRGTTFSRFLVFWAVGTFLVLSWAGEKMPWLNTHIALPTILLAAWTIQRAWNAWAPAPQLDRRLATMLLGVAAIAAAAMLFATFMPGGTLLVTLRLAALVGAVVLISVIARNWGRAAVPAVLVVATVGALSFFSVRTMVIASFVHGDTPDSMLVYTQSSPHILELRDDIDALAEATGRGLDLRIAIDSHDSFSWPWAWYLRDYRAVTFTDFDASIPEGPFDVMFVSASNVAVVNDHLATLDEPRYQAPERYPHRWWFDEVYKRAMAVPPATSCTASTGECGPFEHWINIGAGLHLGPPNLDMMQRMVDGITQDGWPRTWFNYWRDREPGRPPGSIDAYAYFPIGFDRETGHLAVTPMEAVEPGVDESGRLYFGGPGPAPGQFFEPVDIEIDSAGNLYVIDRTSRRLQKFDPEGNHLGLVDVRGDDPEGQSQPWGLTIGPNDEVIVADTFGWRIRVFTSDLQPTGLEFGNPPGEGEPGPFDLFGPRDSVVDPEGLLWVTDTGHHRIQVYTFDGEYVRTVGEPGSGPGQFSEPVGLSVGDDGTIFVADMFNSRVQMFDSEGTHLGEFHIEGWGGQHVEDKPYLAALADGRVAVSLPFHDEVRVYGRDGTLEATITDPADPVARPYGIAETADGTIWVVEGGNGRVRLFDVP